MLTIKSPIELKCATPLVSTGEAFYHRIAGNYDMMTATIGKEDLLHMVTAPAEVYIGEGGMTNIVNTSSVQTRQENNLEIVNNLINRIALTENVDFTYQDRVYITTMLSKLGIQDVRHFMSQVNRLKQDTQNTEQLISLYWNHLSELTEIIEDFNSIRTEQGDVLEQRLEQHKNGLYQQIMTRLQTGAIYQILNNFYANHNQSGGYITSEELQLVEQKRIASNILLNRLQNVVNTKEIPLVYQHDNYYETDNGTVELTSENVTEQITSAVMLNLVDNLYSTRFEKLVTNRPMWLHLEKSLYQTAENTLWRMRTQNNSYSYRSDTKQAVHNYLSQAKLREIKSIEKLLDLRSEERTRELFEEERYYETVRQLKAEQYGHQTEFAGSNDMISPEIEQQAEKILRERYFEQQVEYFTEIRDYLYNVDNRVYAQAENIALTYRNQYTENQTEAVTQQNYGYENINKIYDTAYSEVIRNYTQQLSEQGDIPKEYKPKEEVTAVYQNIENRLLTEEYKSPINLTTQHTDIENTNLSQENVVVNDSGSDDITHLEVKNQGDEITLIQEQLSKINEQNISNYKQYVELLQQQQRVQKKEKSTQRDMRADSLKALANPAQLMEEFRRESEDKQTEGEKQLQQIISILPEETRRIYEKLEQQRSTQQPLSAESVTQNNLGLLIRDIQQVETETHKIEQQVFEHAKTVREVSHSEIERWEDRSAAKPSTRTVTQYSQQDVKLVHKSQEKQIDEETIAELIEQNRTVQKTTQKTTETIEQSHEVINKTVQTNRNTIVRETRDIDAMIRQGVQKQMNAISEQVYSRLERKLENERKRRGY